MDNIFEYRGASDLVYAPITKDDSTGYETGTVKELAGLAKLSKKTASTRNTKFYDNVPAIVTGGTGADDLNIDVSAVPLDTVADITGQVYDDTTGTYIEGEAAIKYFALGYKTQDTNGNEIYVWRLKGTFNIPDEDHETEKDDGASNGQTLVYTGISTIHKFQKDGKTHRGVSTNVTQKLISDEDIAKFFDSVQTPDTITPKTLSM